MTFRKGGKPANSDAICYGNKALANVSHFKYLGITLQASGKVYTKHIKDRLVAAMIAINCIKNLHRISLNTATTLFQLKVTPIITYGLDIIWEHLTKRNLEDIERVKATFLKRALCLSKTTPSRLVYALARQSFYIEDLHHQLLLQSTEAYNLLIREREEKAREIWPDFYATDVMLYRNWTRAGYDLRHIMTRMAVHGFHHLLCKTEKYHQPTDKCMCVCVCVCVFVYVSE